MVSGALSSSLFTAVTSPETGAYTSAAAFTDSTTATSSPALSLRPTAGVSTNTMSPSSSCACWVMPMLMVPSASLLTHSWEAVYFRLQWRYRQWRTHHGAVGGS